MTYTARSTLPLGKFVNQFMRERNETWSNPSCKTGLSGAALEELVSARMILTGDVAILLADHFGVSAINLLDVQRHYRLSICEEDTCKAVAAAQ